MAERAYTVKEVDALRSACEDRYLFGSCVPNADRVSVSYKESDMRITVEGWVRTHMIAGHVAQDLIDVDSQQAELNPCQE